MSSSEKFLHWRKQLKTPYLNGDELPKEGIDVTITEFKEVDIYSQSEKRKTDHTILVFKEFKKPMILTVRKAKSISNVLQTSNMYDWIGKTIHIFPKEEKHFGEYFPVINVKASKIKEKESLTPSHPRWSGAKEAIESGKSTIEAIEKHFKLTPANRKKLLGDD